MAERSGRVEITADIDNQLQAALSGISSSVRSVLETTNALSRNTSNAANSAKQLTSALQGANSSSTIYTRAVHSLIRNQAVLAHHFRNSAKAAEELSRMQRTNTNMTNQEKASIDRLVSSLKAQEAARKGVMQFAYQGDLRRQSDALNQMANRYSMAGNRMSMAITLPFVGFMRTAFSSFKAVEAETVRTEKLINDSFKSMEQVASEIDLGLIDAKIVKDGLAYQKTINGITYEYKTLEGALDELEKGLDKISLKYGVSRELVQGLTGDFAELGIESIPALVGLTEMTAAVEKLGNVDISQSQEFIKSIFQTVLRLKRQTGTLERTADGAIDYANSIKEVRQQVALFNLLENKTQLSLKSTADAFPEVTAAATSFGLSMSEAMALVVPMVSAGFQVGASANSVKVSLQRVVDLTKENSTMIDTLRQTQAGFNFEAGVSVKNIQQLSDAYGELKKGDLGEQGALEFFSKLFGVRQGPRMEVAIANLNQFQEDINRGLDAIAGGPNMRTVEGDIVNRLEEAVQKYSKLQGLGQNFTNMSVRNFADLGEVVRLSQTQNEQISKAFGQARSEVAAYISEEAKKGNDLLAKVSTESGRAILVAAVGNEEAARKFEQEVEMQLETTQNRFAAARETFKAIGRQVVPVLAQILEAFLPILMKLNDFFSKMPGWSKALFGIGLIILAAIGPVMKLMGSITQLRSSMLSLRASGGVFGKMKSQTKEIGVEFLTADSAALKFKNRLTEIGGKFFLKGTAKEIKNLERLMTLEALGDDLGKRGQRTKARLEKKLGISKRSVDMSGLSESTVQDIARRSDVDLGMLGYRKPSFGENPATAMIYEKAGETLGYAFLGVLRQNGFDPTTVKAAVKASTAKAVPVTVKRRGRKPDDDDPGTGGGTGGGPRRPSTGPTGTGGSGAAATVPVDVDIAGVGLTPAIKKNAMDLTYVIEKGTKDVLKTMAKSLNIAKINGKTISAVGVKELRQALINYMKGVKDGITFKPADAQKIKSAAVTTAGANAPPTSLPANFFNLKGLMQTMTPTPTKVRGLFNIPALIQTMRPVLPEIQKASDEGVKKVQKSHAKKTKKVVKKQSEDTVKAIESTPAPVIEKAPGTPIAGISPKAQKFASTVQQVMMNAQLAVNKPIDEVIAALNLVGEGSKRVPFIFTKAKFFELAKILGIQLPPIFNKMGELTDANGQALGITKDSLMKLIQAMTRTAQAPSILTNIAGQTALEFESEVNRALALGAGSKKRFNFKGVTGKLQDAFSRAFTTATGSIFTDVAGKASSKSGLQSGATDYTKIGFKDLERVSGLKQAKSSASQRKSAAITKANQDLIGVLAKAKLSVDKEAPVTIQEFREYVKSTRRVVDALIAQTMPGRAQKAVVRRELTFGPRYEQMLKSPKALDLMSESEYAEFNRKRMAGIDAARTRSEQLKAQAFSGPSISVPKLSDAAIANIKAKEAMELVGNKDQNIPRLLDPETKKVLFNIDERVKRYIKNRTDELVESFGSLDAVPKGALRSATEAARTKVAKELNESKRRQVADITKANEGLQNKLLNTGLTDADRKAINDQIKKNDQLVVAIEKAFKSQMDKLKKMTIDTAPKPAGGGTGKTSLSMGTSMLDPFGGLGGPKAMGPRAPQIGPSLAFVDKGGVPAGVSSVYEEIRQALNIPTKIMDQVIADLEGNHKKISKIGKMSKTEVNARLTKLIEVLRTNMTGVDMTVDNVKDAIVAQRNRIYGLTTKVATKTALSKTEQNALVDQTMESIIKSKKATNEYLTFTDRPLRKLAEDLNKISKGEFKINTKARMGVRKQEITDALTTLRVTVEEAVTKSVVKPVTETVETVKSTGAVLALGMGKLETARAKLAAAAAGTAGSVPIAMGAAAPATRLRGTGVESLTATSKERGDVENQKLRLEYQILRTVKKRFDMAVGAGTRPDFGTISEQRLRNAQSRRRTPASPGVEFFVSPMEDDPDDMVFSFMKPVVKNRFNSINKIGNLISKMIEEMPIPVAIRKVGRVLKTESLRSFSNVTEAIKGTNAPGIMGRAVRAVFNPVKLAEKGIGSFGKVFNKAFSLQNVKAGAGTGAASASVGLSKSLFNAAIGEILAAKAAGSRVIEEAEVVDVNRRIKNNLRNIQRMGVMNAMAMETSDPFSSLGTKVVQSISNYINKIHSGTIVVTQTLDAVGRGVFQTFKEVARLTGTASGLAIQTMGSATVGLTKGLLKLSNSLLGNVGKALNIIDNLALASNKTGAVSFATRLRKGATIGAAAASFNTNLAAIDLANLNVAQKLGALAGIITTGGAQFGITATKLSAQLSLSLLQMSMKIVPFGSAMVSVARSVGTATSAIMGIPAAFQKTASDARLAGQDLSRLAIALKTIRSGAVATGAKVATTMPGMIMTGAGNVAKGVKGFAGGVKSTAMGGLGSAVSMMSYQFGMLGMVAGPVIQNIITGISRIPKVGGPLIMILIIIAGLFVTLKRTTEAWSKYSNGAVEKFKASFDKLMQIVKSLFAPFADFFASFLGGSKDGEKGMEDLGSTIGNIADKVLEFMPKIQDFVDKYILPAIRMVLSGVKLIVEGIWPLVKAVIDFVKVVVRLFKGDFSGAWDAVKSMFGNLMQGIKKIFQGIVVILSPVIKLIVTIFFALVTAIINVLEQIPIFFVNAMRWMIKTVTQIYFSLYQVNVFIVDGILTGIAFLIQGMIRGVQFIVKSYVNAWFTILKGFIFIVDKILEGAGMLVRGLGGAFGWIPGIGDSIRNAANSMGDSLGRAMDVWADRAQGAQNVVLDTVDKIGDKASDFVNGLKGVGNAIGNFVQDRQNDIFRLVDGIADGVNSAIGSASNVSAIARNAINSLIDDLVENNKIKEGIGKNLQEGIENGFKGFEDPTVPDAAGKAIGDAIKESVESAASSFYDAVLGNLSDSIKKSAEEIGEILNQQKEDALKAYDDQIEGINALAEAEERLTETEEYESNRRKRIRERDLQRNNYEKNRALAIYEGRVDDARNLDLEELKNAEDFAKEISDMDKDRQKKLQSENRQDAISIIKNNKENAAKLFEEAIKEFEQYVEEVTKNGTISEEQLSEQFEKIAEKANLTSGSINDTFKDSFSKLPALIQAGLDPTTSESGFFSTEIGKLVEVAKTKFGITAGVGTQDANSILGVTGILLSSQSEGIPAAISAAFADGGVIQSTYGTGLDKLSQYIADKNDPANANSLAAMFKKAIADANAAMEQELLKGQRGIGSAFDKIISQLNDSVKNLAIAEGIKKGMEEAAKAAGEGAQQVVDAAAGAGSVDNRVKKMWVAIRGSDNKWRDWFEPYTKRSIETYEERAKSDPKNYKITFSPVKPPALFKGGFMSYLMGGLTSGGMNKSIPAILHGGEFIIRKSAVDKYGLDMLNQINKGIYMPKNATFNVPVSSYAKISTPSGGSGSVSSETTHNYNIYVDNFIGETEWFNSMMKEYNMKVVPANQKQAGLESRIIKTYNGINRGM